MIFATPKASFKRLRIAIFLCGVALLIGMLLIAFDGLRDTLGPADLAIVLGNTVNPNGQPSARLQARLDKAVQLYQQGWFTQVLVSGGLGQEGFDEATVMKRYLIEQGLPETHIYIDSVGNTTRDTANNAAKLMQANNWHNALVVSQFFHLPRCKLALHQTGITTIYSAHANFFEPRDFYSTLRELPAYLNYLVLNPNNNSTHNQ